MEYDAGHDVKPVAQQPHQLQALQQNLTGVRNSDIYLPLLQKIYIALLSNN